MKFPLEKGLNGPERERLRLKNNRGLRATSSSVLSGTPCFGWSQNSFPSALDFGIVADRHHKLACDFIMVDAVHHTPPTEGEAGTGIIPRTGSHCVAKFQGTVPVEDQTVEGGFGHCAMIHLFLTVPI